MLKESKKPEGFRELLVYKKADALLADTLSFTSRFPHSKTLYALADQMNRSARSVKQNIVEGWKRNSTREYYDFLGFSIGSNAELWEDFRDIVMGQYEMGEKGIKGERGTEIDRLRFYPLDLSLPEPVRLFLKAKEVAFLLDQLQTSLMERMKDTNTLSHADRLRKAREEEVKKDKWLENYIKESGSVRLPNGKVVKKSDV